MKLRIDLEYANNTPSLTDKEFEQLEINILSDGKVILPIIIGQGKVVDSHNRYQTVMKQPELQLSAYGNEFADGFAVGAWTYKNQLGNKNLTPEQRRYLIGKQYDAEKASHGGNRGNQYTSLERSLEGNLPNPLKTCERIAQENGISSKTVIRSAAYAKAVDYADEVAPGFRNELFAGKIKATAADVQEIIRATPEYRSEIVRRLRSATEGRGRC